MRSCRILFLFLMVCYPLGRAYAQQTIPCNSDDGKKHYCQAETHAGVELVKQRSDAPCRKGDSWDYDDSGVWVDKGCRADFLLSGNAGPETGGGLVSRRTVRCSSNNGRRNYCNLNTPHARIRLLQQISGSSCVEGTTWGFDARGIWVDQGCRADFTVETGDGLGGQVSRARAGAPGRTCTEAVGAQRAEQLAKQCLEVSPATHPPCNAQNTCGLITDEIKRSCQLLGHDAPGFCNEYR
jgi:hypothetical protein